jgi:hypothetical protein
MNDLTLAAAVNVCNLAVECRQCMLRFLKFMWTFVHFGRLRDVSL